jgi:hypothetical protein
MWLALLLGGCAEAPPPEEAVSAPTGTASAAGDPDMGGEPLPSFLSRENPIGVQPRSPLDDAADGPVKTIRSALLGNETIMPSHGGNGGHDFTLRPLTEPDFVFHDDWHLAWMYIKTGQYIDSIELWWLDAQGTYHYSGRIGGSGGFGRNVPISPTKGIGLVYGRSGDYVDHLHFYDVTGTTIADSTGNWFFGGSGGSEWKPIFDDARALGAKIHGVYGRAGQYIDRIGFLAYTER